MKSHLWIYFWINHYYYYTVGYLQGSKCCLLVVTSIIMYLPVRKLSTISKTYWQVFALKNDKVVVWKSQSLAACPKGEQVNNHKNDGLGTCSLRQKVQTKVRTNSEPHRNLHRPACLHCHTETQNCQQPLSAEAALLNVNKLQIHNKRVL